ncbi:MAG: flagellar hook capping FlgD N-terminal domain-containing protein [Calditrichia bacterium]
MSDVSTDMSVQGLGLNMGSATAKNILGKDDFLKLLVTQLHYQDPLNPMEGTEFSTQLAQFSSVEELQNIDKSLQQSLDANYLLTTSINNTMASTVIGHDVKAYGNQIHLGDSKQAYLNFDLGNDAKNVKIEILDENDQVKRTINLDNLSKGDQSILWDGEDNVGITLPNGNYHYRVTATDADGNAVSTQSYVCGTITGVRYGNNGAVLMLGDLEIQMSDVYEITNS